MLRELHIANLAVIEDAHIEFTQGLNCFTGQTGAGKSLIIGAFHVLLGHRPASGVAQMVRGGAVEARISAVFELNDAWTTAQVGEAADLPLAPGDELLITRKITSAGRSSVAVNGQPSTAAIVRRIGELLVDIHGQRDHQYLLKPSNQLLILDRYGRSMGLRHQHTELYRKHQQLQQAIEALEGERDLRRRHLELYEFQANEIDDAAIEPGEFAQLKQRHARFSNASRIKREGGAAVAALYDSDGSIIERLQMVVSVLNGLTELDAGFAETTELTRSATLTLEEAARDLTGYTERVDCSQGELDAIEDRLNTMNRLINKYDDATDLGGDGALPDGVDRDDPGAVVLGYRAALARRIDGLRGQDRDARDLEDQIAAVRSQLDVVGAGLTKSRRRAAAQLAPRVEAELHELGMTDAKFEVSVETAEGADSGDPGDPGGAGPYGGDRVEMLVRLNPGQPASPLRAVASGGELSRVMLAIKSILADDDRVSVLVFDEIDANIGGRLGTVIGSKLRALTNTQPVKKPGRRGAASGTGKKASGHQVLCITHLPQIAAFANQHLSIHKAVTGKGKQRQTCTNVAVLDRGSRVAELAEMLAGKDVTATTRKQARELIQLAQA